MAKHGKETGKTIIRIPRGARIAWALFVLSTWLVFSAASFASESDEVKHILVLYSFRYGLVASELLDTNVIVGQGIRKTFEKTVGQRFALYSEHMVTSGIPEDRYFENLRDEYRRRYADQQIDLILVVNFRALNFLIKHGKELWPNTPIVFCGVHLGRWEQLKQLKQLNPNITGVFQGSDKRDVLEVIFKIHPDTRRVVVVMGTSETDQFIGQLYREAFHKYKDKAEIIYMDNLGFKTVLDRVANLPSNSIVLYATLIMDGNGKPAPMNALPLISHESSVPVYGEFDAYVGHGIVGGRVNSFEDQGTAAAELGLRIISGERPKDILFIKEPFKVNLFDGRQLKRWGISEGDLPQESIIRYREPTFYETYKLYIWGGIFLVLFEAVLIIRLLINSARRYRMERELQKAHHRLEDRAAELSQANTGLTNEISERMRTEEKLKENENRLKEVMVSRALLQDKVMHFDRVETMGMLTAAIAHEIGQPLAAILSNAQAAIRFLNKEHPDLNEVREALDDIATNDKRAAEVIQRLRSLLKKKEPKLELLKPNEVIQEIIDLLKSEIVLIKASVAIEIEGEIPAVYGDRIQIQQVVLNLLVNALDTVKNQPEESREVRIFLRGEKTDNILISVSDSGPGIEEHKIENIFEAFHTTKAKGMGMGLSICKSIIEQHNGRIWAANNTGQGAVITFTLPITKRDIS